MSSHNPESGALINAFPCLPCLRHELVQSSKMIADAEAAGAALPVEWVSIPCTYANDNQKRCKLCQEKNDNCQRTLDMIHGNVKSMIATISYIGDLLEAQHPSAFAVAEQGDEFAHAFPRTTRAEIVKALAKLGEAFDVMVACHQREHNLLSSVNQETMMSHRQTYQNKVAARWDTIIQSGLLFWSPGGTLRLRSGDAGFSDWSRAIQQFYRDITNAMEDTHMSQGDVHIALTNLPI